MLSTTWSGGTTPRSKIEPLDDRTPVFARWTNQRIRNFSLEDVHVEGAERIAEAVAKYDVDRFIHVSSYNADVNSPSEFYATKVRAI